MRRIKTLLLTLAVALSSSTAFAGILNGDGAAYAGWTGSTAFTGPYLDPPTNSVRLEGYVDWAVYAPGTFPGGFTANVPIPTDEYVYAYQAFVTGEPPLSQLSVTLETDANNIGSFTGTPNDGTAYATTFEEIVPNSTAIWYFINQTVPTGANSYGLLFTSPYGPKLSVGRTIDDGSQAIVLPVPSPTPPNAPEPATMVLAAFGLVAMGYQVIRRRRQLKNS